MIDKRVAAGFGKWIAEARTKGLAAETETSSVINSVPNALITDRSRKCNAPEEIRPRTDVDAEAAWTELEQCASEAARGISHRGWTGSGRR